MTRVQTVAEPTNDAEVIARIARGAAARQRARRGRCACSGVKVASFADEAAAAAATGEPQTLSLLADVA